MNGTKDVRDVFKAAVGEQVRTFLRGTSSDDAHTFFKYVTNYHYHKCKTCVRYSFKRLGYNNEWSIERLEQSLSRKGKYVFFGATRKNNDSHQKQLSTIKKYKYDDEQLECWNKVKQLQSDHAIGVLVNDDMSGTIYDNGCTTGEKFLSIMNLATRMQCMTECFLLDIFIT